MSNLILILTLIFVLTIISSNKNKTWTDTLLNIGISAAILIAFYGNKDKQMPLIPVSIEKAPAKLVYRCSNNDDLEISVCNDAIFFQYTDLIKSSVKKVPNMRFTDFNNTYKTGNGGQKKHCSFFSNHGLRFQLLCDGKLMNFSQIKRVKDRLICEHAAGKLIINVGQKDFQTTIDVVVVNSTKSSHSYKILANAQLSDWLQVPTEKSSEEMKKSIVYQEPDWIAVKEGYAVMFIKGLSESITEKSNGNYFYQSSDEIAIGSNKSCNKKMQIVMMPFCINMIESGVSGFKNVARMLNYNNIYLPKKIVLRALERIYAVTKSPILLMILLSLFCRFIEFLSSILFFKKKQRKLGNFAEGEEPQIGELITKIFLFAYSSRIICGTGVFYGAKVLWIDDLYQPYNDNIFHAIGWMSNIVVSLLSSAIGVFMALIIMMPIGLGCAYSAFTIKESNKKTGVSVIALISLTGVYLLCEQLLNLYHVSGLITKILYRIPIFTLSTIQWFFLAKDGVSQLLLVAHMANLRLPRLTIFWTMFAFLNYIGSPIFTGYLIIYMGFDKLIGSKVPMK